MRISDWSSDVCSSDLFGTLGPHLLAESGGAALLPDGRLVDGRTGLAVPDRRRLALVGDADGGDLLGARTSVCQGALHHRQGIAPDVLGVVLHPAGLREVLRQLLLRLAEAAAIAGEKNGAAAGGSLVDGENAAFGKIGRAHV